MLEADPVDPLATRWSKRLVQNNTERDPSTAWRTSDGEWMLTTWDGWVYGTRDWVEWRKAGEEPGFPNGDCPSFFPLPGVTSGAGPAPEGSDMPTHVFKTSFDNQV